MADQNATWLFDETGRQKLPLRMVGNDDGSYSLGVATTTGASVDVFVQDQTTPNFYLFFNQAKTTPTTLANAVAIDDNTFVVADATGWTVGTYAGVFYGAENRFFFADVLAVSGTTITVNLPFDYAFPAGSFAVPTNKNLSVDGSTTAQEFALRGAGPGSTLTVDITNLEFRMITDNVPSLTKFGDIVGGVTKALVIRKKDGEYRNLFGFRNNSGLFTIADSYEVFQATNPSQGQDGLLARVTFAGQEKTGVAIRLEPGEELQAIVQDDLTDLVTFTIMAQGHEVED